MDLDLEHVIDLVNDSDIMRYMPSRVTSKESLTRDGERGNGLPLEEKSIILPLTTNTDLNHSDQWKMALLDRARGLRQHLDDERSDLLKQIEDQSQKTQFTNGDRDNTHHEESPEYKSNPDYFPYPRTPTRQSVSCQTSETTLGLAKSYSAINQSPEIDKSLLSSLNLHPPQLSDENLKHDVLTNSQALRDSLLKKRQNVSDMERLVRQVEDLLKSNNSVASRPSQTSQFDHAQLARTLDMYRLENERLATTVECLQSHSRDLRTENQLLTAKLHNQARRIREVREESRVLTESLQQALGKLSEDKARMEHNLLEEREMLTETLRETVDKLANENIHLRRASSTTFSGDTSERNDVGDIPPFSDVPSHPVNGTTYVNSEHLSTQKSATSYKQRKLSQTLSTPGRQRGTIDFPVLDTHGETDTVINNG
eukprot:168847_1